MSYRVERPASRPRVRLEGAALADVLIGLEGRIKRLERENLYLRGRLAACAIIDGVIGKCLTAKGRRRLAASLRRMEERTL